MIAEGRLKSGDQLPPERDLAEKFVVSRTSVREALRALESLGLVEIRPGEGTFVREGSVESLIEPLALVMASQREAIGELFEARQMIEPALAVLAARRATPEALHEMERILEEQAKEVAAGRTGLEQDAEFHSAIGAAAHNRAITRIAHAVMDLLRQSREESLNTPGRPTRSHEDHRRLLAAIRARYDADAADAVAGTDSGPAGPARSVRDLIERGTPRAGASPWLKEHQGPRVADPWPFFFVVARVGPRRV